MRLLILKSIKFVGFFIKTFIFFSLQNRYIILKGSVNVVILGKGIVCTLNDGDDFGKLAVMNETVRAATIVTNEDNCHFLKGIKILVF